MDRLHAVTAAAVALALVGCDRDRPHAPPETTKRFDAVAARPDKPVSLDEFCDVRGDGATATHFAPPALASGAIPSDGWRWINLWATWCKPCIEELPMLASWRRELAAAGVAFEPVFVSVDVDDATVASYRQAHAGTPASLRLAQPDALPDWLKTIGLDANATIPIHLFVDGHDRVRCARAGALRPGDLAAVKQVLALP